MAQHSAAWIAPTAAAAAAYCGRGAVPRLKTTSLLMEKSCCCCCCRMLAAAAVQRKRLHCWRGGGFCLLVTTCLEHANVEHVPLNIAVLGNGVQEVHHIIIPVD